MNDWLAGAIGFTTCSLIFAAAKFWRDNMLLGKRKNEPQEEEATSRVVEASNDKTDKPTNQETNKSDTEFDDFEKNSVYKPDILAGRHPAEYRAEKLNLLWNIYHQLRLLNEK